MQHITRKLKNALNAFEQGHLKQAEILYLQCLDKMTDKDTVVYKQALHGLSFVKVEMEQLTDASELYSQLLKIAEQEGNKEEEAIVLHQLGIIYRMDANLDKAISYFKQEQSIYETLQGDFHLELSANYFEQGMTYNAIGSLKKSRELMEIALAEAKLAKDQMVIGYVYRALGDNSVKDNNISEALENFAKAQEAFQNEGAESALRDLKERINKIQ